MSPPSAAPRGNLVGHSNTPNWESFGRKEKVARREDQMAKVLYEKSDRIARVTLNRPEAKNAIDPETHELLWQAWEDFAADDSVDVAIFTGAGDAFCAGADLKTFIPPWIESATPP